MEKKVYLILLTALILGATFLSTKTAKKDAFEEYKAQFGTNWAEGEEQYRRLIF
jgi:hypothetical protein